MEINVFPNLDNLIYAKDFALLKDIDDWKKIGARPE